MKHRNPVKNWAITFPQIGDIATRENFPDHFPPHCYSICAREEHEDGGWHLHLGLSLKKGINHTKMLNWIKTKWPDDWKRIHFEGTKNMQAWKDYCRKEDVEAIEIGDLKRRPAWLKEMVKEEEKYFDKSNELYGILELVGIHTDAEFTQALLRFKEEEYFKELGY